MRLIRCRISMVLLGDMLRCCDRTMVTSDFPDDAQVVEIFRDDYDRAAGTFSVLCEHASFDEVPEAGEIPIREVTFKRLREAS